MIKGRRIALGDASEDGHPCQVALAFRDAAIRDDLTDELPAEVLDLAIQFAWIGKAITRTVHIHDWLRNRIDPNTREIVAAMAVDSRARQLAVLHATKGVAGPHLDANLKAIRKSSAFRHAVDVVSKFSGSSQQFAEVERLARLAEIALDLSDTRRLPAETKKGDVISFEAFKRQRALV